ncbi:hypothetical protein ACTXT7_005739 [Hymenolepis weldensis]
MTPLPNLGFKYPSTYKNLDEMANMENQSPTELSSNYPETVKNEVAQNCKPIPALGLGRIFDVSSSESSSVSSCSDEEFDLDLSPILKSSKKPDRISIVEVEDLDSPASMEAVLSAEGSRGSTHWLVVYVKGSTTAVLIPPRESHHNHSFKRSGLTACLEWLEASHMSQILVAVPFGGGESMCKKLLFLGFSILPKGIVNEQLPSWCDGYAVLAELVILKAVK